MSGKNHMPSGGQASISSLSNRRTSKGVLDSRRFVEADLRMLEVVGAFGSKFLVVKNPGGNATFIVANQAGQTFGPGAQVLGASTTGMPREAVIGGAPGNGGSSGSMRPSRRNRPPATVAPNQYAFGINATDAVATAYVDGSYALTRGSTPGLVGVISGCILVDSSELVGEGTGLFRNAESDLEVWDVLNDLIYSYSAPVGWNISSPLLYYDGALYWFEREPVVDLVSTTIDLRLRTSATDLTSVSTISTYSLTIALCQADLGGSVLVAFMDSTSPMSIAAVGDTGAVVYTRLRPNDGNGERTDLWDVQLRFPLSGAAASRRLMSLPPEGSFDWIQNTLNSTVGTDSFRFAFRDGDEYNPEEHFLHQKSDDATTAATSIWTPVTVGAALTTPLSLNTAPNGTTVQLYSNYQVYPGPVTTYCLVRGTTSWTMISTTVQSFDISGPYYPDAMFYFGAD